MMKRITILAFAFSSLAPAQLIVADAKSCGESEMAATMVLEESPVRLNFNTNSNCIGESDKGALIRVWKYKHRYQRVAAPKEWKLALDNGDGKPTSFAVPHNSIVGVFLHQKDGEKWKAYRGGSRNPMALTQPPVLLTLRKVTETKAGGLKQEHLVWDVMSIEPLPLGVADLRIEQVWIWQGLNPIAKRVVLGTSKSKLTLQTE